MLFEFRKASRDITDITNSISAAVWPWYTLWSFLGGKPSWILRGMLFKASYAKEISELLASVALGILCNVLHADESVTQKILWQTFQLDVPMFHSKISSFHLKCCHLIINNEFDEADLLIHYANKSAMTQIGLQGKFDGLFMGNNYFLAHQTARKLPDKSLIGLVRWTLRIQFFMIQSLKWSSLLPDTYWLYMKLLPDTET